ncbi:hypothetical protein SLS62_010265 [Diatrype stigma]|uniref:Adenylate kinase n=1 Tax=Diatrype stigma TaxID=117547 RepID=A0AAN9UAP6_9PEZI
MLDQSTPRRTGELFRCIATRAGKWVAHLGSVIRDIAVYASQWLLLDRIKTKTRSICTQCPLVSPLLVGAVAPPEEEKPPLIVFLLGCPGAGKGTQSALLKAAFPGPPLLTHLSYGDLLRHVDRIPGSWVSAFPRRRGGTGTTTSSPHLPADAAVQLLRETIVEAGIRRHGQRVWLVDGSPRSDRHVAAWAAAARMPSAQLAIYLSCPPETLIRRVLDRGGSAASSFSSSSSSSSSLSTTAERRADDAVPELVRERVERNGREREALLAALAAAGVRVVRVDADRDVDAVGREVQAHFQMRRDY